MIMKIKEQIKGCRECHVKNNHSPPLLFSCTEPRKVKCFIISEQPKEYKEKNYIDEELLKEHLKKLLLQQNKNNKKLIDWLVITFGEDFVTSIKNDNGLYYWTHQTKCPSRERQCKSRCSDKWLCREIETFLNLKCVIALGAEAYRGVAYQTKGPKQIKHMSYYDYLWKEIETIILNRNILKEMMVKIGNSEVLFIALPHPSGANALNNFLPNLNPLLQCAIKEIYQK